MDILLQDSVSVNTEQECVPVENTANLSSELSVVYNQQLSVIIPPNKAGKSWHPEAEKWQFSSPVGTQVFCRNTL